MSHIVEWHGDIDQSGGKVSRSGLDAIMERIRDGATEGVVVSKLDRLTRAGLIDSLTLIEEIQEHGGVFAASDLGLDQTTPEGEMSLGFMLSLTRWQRRRLMKLLGHSKADALERGTKMGPTRFGYLRADGLLVPDPDTAPIVKRAFKLATQGAITRVDRLPGGARPPPPLNDHDVRPLIANRTYIGEQSYGGAVNPDAPEQLVICRALQRAQFQPVVKRAPSATYPLTGVLRCADCGQPMSGTRLGKGHQGSRCSSQVLKKRDPSKGCDTSARERPALPAWRWPCSRRRVGCRRRPRGSTASGSWSR